tara:strand:- start:927 stop:1802 length:876 start_codon:yes stop_codon:yes gene_type:complete
MDVVYGHTDSIYIKVDSIEQAHESLKEINSYVRESFPNVLQLDEHPVVLEFEKYFSSLGVGVTKNRNAGLISWEDGVFLDEPKFTMTGFTAKRVSETPLSKRIQTDVLKMWVEGNTEDEIVDYCRSEYLKTLNGETPITDVVKRSRLKENRFALKCSCGKKYNLLEIYDLEYCSKCAKLKKHFTTLDGKRPSIGSGIAGMLYGHEELGFTYDDSYVFMKIIPSGFYTNPLTDERKAAEWVAGTTFSDLEKFTPDWGHYAEQVISKAKPIFEAMGWETLKIKNKQKKLEEWW